MVHASDKVADLLEGQCGLFDERAAEGKLALSIACETSILGVAMPLTGINTCT